MQNPCSDRHESEEKNSTRNHPFRRPASTCPLHDKSTNDSAKTEASKQDSIADRALICAVRNRGEQGQQSAGEKHDDARSEQNSAKTWGVADVSDSGDGRPGQGLRRRG